MQADPEKADEERVVERGSSQQQGGRGAAAGRCLQGGIVAKGPEGGVACMDGAAARNGILAAGKDWGVADCQPMDQALHG
jgi:hypothetical protein